MLQIGHIIVYYILAIACQDIMISVMGCAAIVILAALNVLDP